jgi:hypothetical protein
MRIPRKKPGWPVKYAAALQTIVAETSGVSMKYSFRSTFFKKYKEMMFNATIQVIEDKIVKRA